MAQTLDVASIRFFLRLLIGFVLLSTSRSKLSRPRHFRQAILDYQILLPFLESQRALLTIVTFGIPALELAAGFGFISGFLLVPATFLSLGLVMMFTGVILLNLIRGRYDLSCHCGGALGDHRISWWLVGRNILLLVSFLFLLWTPPDPFTVGALIHRTYLLSIGSMASTALLIALLAIGTIIIFVLIDKTLTILRSK